MILKTTVESVSRNRVPSRQHQLIGHLKQSLIETYT